MNGIIALFLSMVAPGAGQIFNGDYWLGALLGGMFALGKTAVLPLLVRGLRLKREESILKLFYWFNWLYSVCVICYRSGHCTRIWRYGYTPVDCRFVRVNDNKRV